MTVTLLAAVKVTTAGAVKVTNQQARTDEDIAEKISIIGETSRTDANVSDWLLSY